MKAAIGWLSGLVFVVSASAEPLLEGQVRLDSGEPVANAQVRIFDMTDLQRGAIARATTDATGYFALPLASLGGSALPQAWTLGQNYPNPFNPSTLIPYHVPTAAPVRLEVLNVLGQRVATLVDEERPAGVHTAAWNATDAVGRAVGAGVYFYRLSSAGQPMLTRRMVLLDGQAGQAAASVPMPTGPAAPAAAAEGVYGLAVTGAGLVTYVDASFGVWSGMAPVEVVVDAVEGLPRGKALTSGVLGDVNGDGQVNLDDVLLVLVLHIVNGSVAFLPNGAISLGDVNGDGQVNLDDALLLMTYVTNPSDPSLPMGIGQEVPGCGETPLDDGDSSRKKDKIVEVLFGLDTGEADAKTHHDYNNYGACPCKVVKECTLEVKTKCDGYRGGHAGWDVQTQSVAGDDKTADEEFYSLTSGRVIAIDKEDLGKIAVYDSTANKTTLYLHAREIYVSLGETVNVLKTDGFSLLGGLFHFQV